MKLLKFSLIFALIGQNTFPVLMSLSLFKYKAKKIMLIGAEHTAYRDEVIEDDRIETKIMSKWFTKLSKKKEPVLFLLEASNWKTQMFHDQLESNPDVYLGLCNILPIWAVQHDFNYNNIRFEFADSRTQTMGILSMLYNQLSTLNFPEDKQALKQIRKDLNQQFGTKTINNLLSELQSYKNKFKKILSFEFIKSDAAKKYIKSLLKQYDSELLSIQEILEFYDEEKQLVDLYFDLAHLEIEKFIEFHLAFKKLTRTVADLGFIYALLGNLDSSDNIIFYTGNLHTIELINLLNKLKFTKLFSEGLFEKPANYSGRQFNNKSLKKLLAHI